MTWWAALYDDWVADQLLVRGEVEVAGTLQFLTERLGLSRGSRLFDQCCGIGSLALPLAARGVQVIAVDQSEAYVARTRSDAAARRLDLEVVCADARRYVPASPVDAAVNWWTSFGYAETDDENEAMLSRASEALVPGGRFALDTMNVPGILRGFQRDVVLRRRTPRGDVLLLRESAIDLARGRMEKTWSFFVEGRREVERKSSVRLYMPDAIATMLERAGFHEVLMLGSTDGEPLQLDSPRLIALARKRP